MNPPGLDTQIVEGGKEKRRNGEGGKAKQFSTERAKNRRLREASQSVVGKAVPRTNFFGSKTALNTTATVNKLSKPEKEREAARNRRRSGDNGGVGIAVPGYRKWVARTLKEHGLCAANCQASAERLRRQKGKKRGLSTPVK